MQKTENYESKEKEIEVKILRFNPMRDEGSRWQMYKVPIETKEKVSVLSLLQYIYENLDPSLTFLGPCEKGLCGMCSVVVNGKVGLACKALVNSDVTIEPLKGKKIISDLVVDRSKNND